MVRFSIHCLSVLILAIILLAWLSPDVRAQGPICRKIYIRNRCDRPIGIHFSQADPRKNFTVVRVNENANALIEYITPGRWQASVIELLNGTPIGRDSAIIVLESPSSNAELLIRGRWGIGPAGYDLIVNQ